MRRLPRLTLAILIASCWAASAPGQDNDPFAANVRSTPALTPAEEQKSFHLQPGFKIERFASDP